MPFVLGVTNANMTCYMASVIQVLNQLELFMDNCWKFYETHRNAIGKDDENPLFKYYMLYVFKNYNPENTETKRLDLYDCIVEQVILKYSGQFALGRQHDAMEFMECMLNEFEMCLRSKQQLPLSCSLSVPVDETNAPMSFHKLFQFTLVYEHYTPSTCLSCRVAAAAASSSSSASSSSLCSLSASSLSLTSSTGLAMTSHAKCATSSTSGEFDADHDPVHSNNNRYNTYGVTCKKNYQVISYMSLSIKHVWSSSHSFNTNKQNKSTSLLDLIDMYFQDELINNVMCDKCKVPCKTTKTCKRVLNSFGPYVIIHLSRTQYQVS
jgi:hypothetical protein